MKTIHEKQSMKNKLSSLFLSSIAASSILLAPALHAANITWDAGGGADKNWSTDANWSDNAPATGDDVTFDATGALASGTTSTVDASISIASLTYNLENNTLKQTTSIAAGQTLAVTGNFLLAPSNASTTLNTDVIITGATGALTVNGTSFQVGQTANGTTDQTRQSLDMSGLGTLTANLGASGIFRMNGSAATVRGPLTTLVKLAANSTITANIIGVGDNTGKGGQAYILKLGSTANTFNANTINIGQSGNVRSNGELSFETGTGTLKLRAADGTSAVTAMNLVNSGLTGNANLIATANFAGHDVDAKITTLTMGRRSAGANALGTATFTFDTGTLEVGTLNLGEASAAATLGTINATMNIGGGTATFGAINMATNAGVVGTIVNGTLNFTNGTTTVNGNILKGGGNGTTANLNLKGGTLDMTAGNIGSLANSINLTAESGTLKNVAQINGGGSLEKTTAGTLVLSGTNTYTGATSVSNGVLKLTLPEALSTNTAVNISTTTGAKIELAFSGTVTVKSLTVDGELLTRNKVYSSANLPIAFAPGDGLLYTLEGTAPKGTMIRFF